MMRGLELDCLLFVGGSAAYGRCWFNFRYVTNILGNDESTVPAMLDSIAVAQNHVFLGVVSMFYWSTGVYIGVECGAVAHALGP